VLRPGAHTLDEIKSQLLTHSLKSHPVPPAPANAVDVVGSPDGSARRTNTILRSLRQSLTSISSQAGVESSPSRLLQSAKLAGSIDPMPSTPAHAVDAKRYVWRVLQGYAQPCAQWEQRPASRCVALLRPLNTIHTKKHYYYQRQTESSCC